jgi:hypothetical protein
MRTLQELAAEALAVQDASNLSDAAQSFAAAMKDLGEYVSGPRERNEHPITLLWVDKLADLSRYDARRVQASYREVYVLAGRATR